MTFAIDFTGDLGKRVPSLCAIMRDRCTRARRSLLSVHKGVSVKNTGVQGHAYLRDRRAMAWVIENFEFLFIF